MSFLQKDSDNNLSRQKREDSRGTKITLARATKGRPACWVQRGDSDMPESVHKGNKDTLKELGRSNTGGAEADTDGHTR